MTAHSSATPQRQEQYRSRVDEIVFKYLDKCDTTYPDGSSAEDTERDLVNPMLDLLGELLAPRSEIGEQEGYPGIAHDLETMRTALTNLLQQYEGVYDKRNSDGEGYQSDEAAAAEDQARAALAAPLSASALKGESVDEVLEIVGTFGPNGADIREELRWLIMLAEEVKALRKQRAAFSMDASNLQHELDVLRSTPSAIAHQEGVTMSKGWIEAAKCPECDGSGFNAHQVAAGEWEQVQCQWCDERHQAIGALDSSGAGTK